MSYSDIERWAQNRIEKQIREIDDDDFATVEVGASYAAVVVTVRGTRDVHAAHVAAMGAVAGLPIDPLIKTSIVVVPR